MLAMLGFIPLLGPIIQGISSIFGSYFNKEIAVVKAGAEITIAETQASAQIIHDTDSIGLRIMRDAVCLPVVVWTMLIGWDTIMIHHYPNLVFIVEKYPDSVAYLPYAVIVFLLGNIGLNMFGRRR